MVTFEYTVRDEAGIHARPAGMLVNKVKSLGVTVTIEKDGKTASASKLFAVMGLGVKCGETVMISVEGENELAASDELLEFFKSNL